MHLEIEDMIITKAMNGDIACFEKLVIIYEKMIYNVCFRYFNNEEDAKDAAQEVFIKIYKNLKKYNFKCKFSTWTYKITVNCCIDSLRKKKSRPQTEEIDENTLGIRDKSKVPDDAIILKEAVKYIEDAINSLPTEHKTFIVLRDINGLPYEDIADITGYNLGTVKSKIFRARQYLKKRLITYSEEVSM